MIAYALSLLLSPLLGRLILRDNNENLLTIRKLLMLAAVISIVCAVLGAALTTNDAGTASLSRLGPAYISPLIFIVLRQVSAAVDR